MRARRPIAAAWVVAAILGGGPAVGQAASDDPGVDRQWGLERIGAPAAWAVARGAGITIAVVDSGVSGTHPDLAGLAGAADCTGAGPCRELAAGEALDDAGHGTHVAGIAAATAGNGTGVAGVAPDAHLLSVKALTNQCGSDSSNCQARGTQTDVAEAIRWAVDRGADVINLSVGNIAQQVLGPSFADALDHAFANGAIPVLAAGNEPLPVGSLVDVPAVLVAGTTRDDGHADYSGALGNVRWAVAAPGGVAEGQGTCESDTPNGILSTYFLPQTATDTYACIAGTSMAAPHVAGALAVLRSAGLDPQAAIDRLLATARDLGPPGFDSQFGSGRIDLATAVDGLEAAGAGTPSVTGEGVPTSPPATGAPVATTAPASPSTIPPAVTTPPVLDTAAGDFDGEPAGSDRLPAAPLTAAVLAVVAVAGAHAWRFLTASTLGRRTPDR